MRIVIPIIAIILTILVGVTFVWAFNPPTQSPPGGSGAIAVDINNNVGIGTSSPGAKLGVADTGATDRAGILTTRENHSIGIGVDRGGTNWGGSIFIDGVKKMTIDSNAGVMIGSGYVGTTAPNNGLIVEGNVGIGTTSPGAKLDVYSSTDLGIRYSGIRTHRPASFGQFAFMDYGYSSAAAYFGSSYTGSAGVYGTITLRQYTQSDVYRDALHINSNGNVGIGTTSPAQKLDIAGTIQATGFKMPTGAADGRILKSDSAGVGSWQVPPPTFNEASQANCAWTEWMSSIEGGLLTCPAGKAMVGLNTYEYREKSDDRRTWFTILCCGS